MKLNLIDLFKKITWAKNGDVTDFSQTNYEAGWAHLGDDTPTVQDFNYVQQMNDKKDQWLFNQLKAVLDKAGINATENNVNALRDAILSLSKGYSQPKSLNAETVNFIDETGHTHEIAKATLKQAGIVQLDSSTTSNAENKAATLKAVKVAYDLARSKQSPATTLAGYGISDFKVKPFVGNVDTLQTDGIYAVAQASRSQNLPAPGNNCHIQVIGGGDSTWCRQIAYIAYSGDMYERHQLSYQRDEWSPWKKLILDGLSESQLMALLLAKADKTAFDSLHDLFIGVPTPYPLATVPAGCLAMNGQRFDKNRYPKLGQKYPSGVLPDLRGEFIRGWDNGRRVDSGRGLLSWQKYAFEDHFHYLPTQNGEDFQEESGITALIMDNFGTGKEGSFTGVDQLLNGFRGNNHALSNSSYPRTYSSRIRNNYATANETRPRNIAFHYICLAA